MTSAASDGAPDSGPLADLAAEATSQTAGPGSPLTPLSPPLPRADGPGQHLPTGAGTPGTERPQSLHAILAATETAGRELDALAQQGDPAAVTARELGRQYAEARCHALARQTGGDLSPGTAAVVQSAGDLLGLARYWAARATADGEVRSAECASRLATQQGRLEATALELAMKDARLRLGGTQGSIVGALLAQAGQQGPNPIQAELPPRGGPPTPSPRRPGVGGVQDPVSRRAPQKQSRPQPRQVGQRQQSQHDVQTHAPTLEPPGRLRKRKPAATKVVEPVKRKPKP